MAKEQTDNAVGARVAGARAPPVRTPPARTQHAPTPDAVPAQTAQNPGSSDNRIVSRRNFVIGLGGAAAAGFLGGIFAYHSLSSGGKEAVVSVPIERYMTEADLPGVYNRDFVIEGLETVARKVPRTRNFDPDGSYIKILAFDDIDSDRVRTDGTETSLLFGVGGDLPTAEILYETAQALKKAGTVCLLEPPRDKLLMVTDNSPRYRRSGDILVFDHRLTRYSVPSAVAIDPNMTI